MRIFKIIFFLTLAINIFSCSTFKTERVELIREPEKPIIDTGIVIRLVDQANTQLELGEFEKGQRIYEDLLTTYKSENGSFETAILTNLAIASLQSGDREKFLSMVERLNLVSSNLNQLSRNTQIVLLLGMEMTDGVRKRDLRIHSQLYQAVNQAIYLK
ncbi:MAG: hypothetical protein HOJ48_00050 [Desulfobacula sp.]|jgi:hypothetical protein|nr:hypothetical protein [Desulfobacula sp.]